MRIRWTATLLTALLVCDASVASPRDKVRFGTDWVAQADHGGFYQALADGTYARYGLDVEIVPGGPNAANQALLAAGRLDFFLGTPQNSIASTLSGVSLVDIAAIYQKAPQVLMAHPQVDRFEDLATLPDIFMSAGGYESYFAWMRTSFTGFRDEQYRPYNGSLTPFIADSASAQQGLLTSEPYLVHEQAGWTPSVFLLADNGYQPYAQTITVRPSLIETKPELVQRFIDATIEGWHTYLYGDNQLGNALIKAENPDMTDGLLEYALDVIKQHGLVDSGDAASGGIGCLTDARYETFVETLVKADIVPDDFDYRQAFDPRFVCKKTGNSRSGAD